MGLPLRAPSVRHDAAWIADCLNRADAVLAAPPAKSHIRRVKPKGQLVARFVLPLELCPTTNFTRHGKPWALAKLKKQIGLLLFIQHRPRKAPLPGRPFVRCIRFSSSAPDAYNDGFKAAIDRLCSGKNALGFLRDDRPSDAEVWQGWEYAAPGRGFGLVEVYA